MNRGTDEPVQSLFDRLYEKAKRIEVDGETLWRVEGDVLLDEDQLRRYARQQEALREMRFTMREAGRPVVISAELVGITEDDKILRWAPGLALSYAVLRRTFTIGGEA